MMRNVNDECAHHRDRYSDNLQASHHVDSVLDVFGEFRTLVRTRSKCERTFTSSNFETEFKKENSLGPSCTINMHGALPCKVQKF